VNRVLFISGTRADYGKLKPIIDATANTPGFEVHIAVTGMHMLPEYGLTRIEVERNLHCEIHPFDNFLAQGHLADSFAHTVSGLNKIISEIKPDLVMVHGDRMEALAGATSAMFNHVLIGHIEGGEISGTLDETMRHAITKLSNFHFVSNEDAQKRIIQMGENPLNIYRIGSPEADVMMSEELPELITVKDHYNITFDEYGILIFHPDSHELLGVREHAKLLVDSIIDLNENFIVILPNSDPFSEEIKSQYLRLKGLPNFTFFPSMRFEYYLSALKSARFLIGNSSSGVREAPIYGIPSLDLGKRQENRSSAKSIFQSDYVFSEIVDFFQRLDSLKFAPQLIFGDGTAAQKFAEVISRKDFLRQKTDKSFVDFHNRPGA
jgi:UDP-N-acetylglucosamine 2-epimerase (hydrolysing)